MHTQRARRQWSLARDPAFRYRHLLAFDEALMSLDEVFDVLAANWLCVSREDESKYAYGLNRIAMLCLPCCCPIRIFRYTVTYVTVRKQNALKYRTREIMDFFSTLANGRVFSTRCTN
jgi:hypothetical protein